MENKLEILIDNGDINLCVLSADALRKILEKNGLQPESFTRRDTNPFEAEWLIFEGDEHVLVLDNDFEECVEFECLVDRLVLPFVESETSISQIKLYKHTFPKKDKSAIVLGVRRCGHDSSAVLLKDGKIISALESERVTRDKHHYSPFPIYASAKLLEQSGLTLDDVDYVALGWNENFYKDMPSSPAPSDTFYNSLDRPYHRDYFKTKFSPEVLNRSLKRLSKLTGRGDLIPPAVFVNHHRCHAASAYYTSGLSEPALILVNDAQGEKESITVWIGSEGSISKLDEVLFPNSIGLLYRFIAGLFNYGSFSEGEIMGLAAYGKPRNDYESELQIKLRDFLHTLYEVTEENLFTLKPWFFDEGNPDGSRDKSVTPEFMTQLNEILPEVSEGKIPDPDRDRGYAILAYELQQMTENIILNIIKNIQKKYPKTQSIKHLCLSGGVALNILANKRIADESLFLPENIFIPPVPNDSGVSLGAAQEVSKILLGCDVMETMETASLGVEYTDAEIAQCVEQFGLKQGVDYFILDDDSEIANKTAEVLMENGSIAWFQGRSEYGPRALGNRSILALAGCETGNKCANEAKKRQWWRPSALSIVKERAGEFVKNSESMLFMTMAANCTSTGFQKLKSGLHLADFTTRPQAVSKQTNPRYWALLNYLGDQTGVPAVLNTSFNIKEPVVETPFEAINTFYYMSNISHLMIGNILIKRTASLIPTVVSFSAESKTKAIFAQFEEAPSFSNFDALLKKAEVAQVPMQFVTLACQVRELGTFLVKLPIFKEMFTYPMRKFLNSYLNHHLNRLGEHEIIGLKSDIEHYGDLLLDVFMGWEKSCEKFQAILSFLDARDISAYPYEIEELVHKVTSFGQTVDESLAITQVNNTEVVDYLTASSDDHTGPLDWLLIYGSPNISVMDRAYSFVVSGQAEHVLISGGGYLSQSDLAQTYYTWFIQSSPLASTTSDWVEGDKQWLHDYALATNAPVLMADVFMSFLEYRLKSIGASVQMVEHLTDEYVVHISNKKRFKVYLERKNEHIHTGGNAINTAEYLQSKGLSLEGKKVGLLQNLLTQRRAIEITKKQGLKVSSYSVIPNEMWHTRLNSINSAAMALTQMKEYRKLAEYAKQGFLNKPSDLNEAVLARAISLNEDIIETNKAVQRLGVISPYETPIKSNTNQ